MPTLPQMLQMRRRRESQRRKDPWSRAGLSLAFFVCLALALGAVSLTLASSSLFRDLPSLDILPALLEPPNGRLLQPTRLYDRSGERLLLTLNTPPSGEWQYLYLPGSTGLRGVNTAETPITLVPAPSLLISTTLATAAVSFELNEGQGADSFLAQWGAPADQELARRLADELLVQDEAPGLRRQLRIRMLAAQLSERYGRYKILEWYLNSASFGRNAYGADAAARAYYNRPAAELSLAQAAYLSAVAASPDLTAAADPDPVEMLARQRMVIQILLEQGEIDEGAAIAALQPGQAEPIPPVAPDTSEPELYTLGMDTWTALTAGSPAPDFTRLVLAQLAREYAPERLQRGGFRVITTLDYALQEQADCVTTLHLSWLAATGAEVLSRGPDTGCDAARFLPEQASIPLDPSSALGAQVSVIDPSSGEVLALVGESGIGGRPPGTLLTPFIYLTAFGQGFSPATLVWDIPGDYPVLIPEGFSGDGSGYNGPGRLRIALANDWMAPAVRTLAQVGPEKAWWTAQQLGLTGLEENTRNAYNLPLDGGEIHLMDAVRAFGAITNGGVLAGRPSTRDDAAAPLEAEVILRVEAPDGYEAKAGSSAVQDLEEDSAVISPELAYLMTDVLSDEPARWPGLGHPNNFEIGRPAAVKAGKTVSGQDGWAVGATPQRVVGVWVGAVSPGPASLDPARLPSAASALWRAVTLWEHQDLPVQDWTAPAGLSRVAVCETSGLLPTPYCGLAAGAAASAVEELFLAGTEPQQRDTLYQRVPINRENGLLATVFTPPELVDERIFLTVPAEAQEWLQHSARSQALVPPDAYDPLPAQPDPELSGLQVRVDSPAPFSTQRGQVQLRGHVGGEAFAHFRIQVGSGLYPHQWLQLGIDQTRLVEDGPFATWNTASHEDGLYILQILVTRKDRSTATRSIPVTVDNSPPQAALLSPASDQEILLPQDEAGGGANRIVTLLADPRDNLALSSVEFWLDGELLASLPPDGPYAFPWQALPGEHILELRVADAAGNSDSTRITFSVH